MKTRLQLLMAFSIAAMANAQTNGAYTNFIRQVQIPTGVQWDASVAASGEQNSSLPVDLGGSRFELWTVLSEPLTSYLLDTRYVSAYAPVVDVAIRSEDPYTQIPRTRADRPFQVDITISGLLGGASDPEVSKAVQLLRHVQSYGADGVGRNLDRSQATLLSSALLNQNGTQTLSFALNSVPGEDRTKVRGEERFSVFSLEEPGISPELQIASQYIQIWPVADGSISGISPDEKIRFKAPQLTVTLNDLYPESRTYVQVYRGEAQLGVEGTMVPGTSLVINDSVPNDRVLVLDDYDAVFEEDGRYTMELLTITPFGTDRLAYVTIEIDRSITLQGTFTTLE